MVQRRLEEKEIIDIEEAYNDVREAVAEKERNDYTQSLTDYTQYSRDKSAYEHPNDEPGVPRIELITAEEYDLTPPLYSKVILSYYEDDDILCYEESNEMLPSNANVTKCNKSNKKIKEYKKKADMMSKEITRKGRSSWVWQHLKPDF